MRKMKSRIAVLTAMLVAAATCIRPSAAYAQGEETQNQGTEEYIIMAKNDDAMENITNEYDNVLEEEMSDTSVTDEENVAVVELTAKEAADLKKDSDTVYVEKDATLYGMTDKTDAIVEADYRDSQWYLDAIHLEDCRAGEDTVRVGILDSGVNYSPDIDVAVRENILAEDEEIAQMFNDCNGHGTAIAGIIGAKDNGEGITGICPQAEIYSFKVLDENNSTQISTVVNGIYKSIEAGCDIINMSFGTYTNSEILHQAIKDAYDAGILLIASAGNSEGKVMYPAAYSEVMAVGATDEAGMMLEGTADGKGIEVLAPGTKILTTDAMMGAITVCGTSMSAAEVTGAAALIWSKDRSKSADFIRRLISNTGRTVQNAGNGERLLDIENSVETMNEFEALYESGVIDYLELAEETEEAGSYDTDGLVNGMWTRDDHGQLANKVTAGYGIDKEFKELLIWGSRAPDDTSYNENRRFHGSGNYMQALHYMYVATATFWDMYTNPEKYKDKYPKENVRLMIKNVAKKAYKHSGMNEADNGFGKNGTNTVYKKMIEAGLKEKCKVNVEDENEKGNKTNAERCFYISAGIAAHLIGDTFAHRTMVPDKTVKGDNSRTPLYDNEIMKIVEIYTGEEQIFKGPLFGYEGYTTSSNHETESLDTLEMWAKFSSNYRIDKVEDANDGKKRICGYWKCFQKAVLAGIIEFRDIKMFSSEGVKGVTYEDNINFCGERYEEAQLAYDVFFTNVVNQESYDGIGIMWPVNGCVLNSFQSNSKKANEPQYDTIYKEFWKDCSFEHRKEIIEK